jgi:hypothetical protein
LYLGLTDMQAIQIEGRERLQEPQRARKIAEVGRLEVAAQRTRNDGQ